MNADIAHIREYINSLSNTEVFALVVKAGLYNPDGSMVGAHDVYATFTGPRRTRLVTPEMRAEHFRATGMYEEDLYIWVWFNKQKELDE